jgi:hypothetical protein
MLSQRLKHHMRTGGHRALRGDEHAGTDYRSGSGISDLDRKVPQPLKLDARLLSHQVPIAAPERAAMNVRQRNRCRHSRIAPAGTTLGVLHRWDEASRPHEPTRGGAVNGAGLPDKGVRSM